MGACFIHVNVRPYKLQIGVSFLETLYILHEGFFGSLPRLGVLEVIFTTPLHHILIEQLFTVLGLLDVVAVVLYLSVGSLLFGVVLIQSFTEDFSICFFDVFVYQSDILMGLGDINVVWGRLAVLFILTPIVHLTALSLWH